MSADPPSGVATIKATGVHLGSRACEHTAQERWSESGGLHLLPQATSYSSGFMSSGRDADISTLSLAYRYTFGFRRRFSGESLAPSLPRIAAGNSPSRDVPANLGSCGRLGHVQVTSCTLFEGYHDTKRLLTCRTSTCWEVCQSVHK